MPTIIQDAKGERYYGMRGVAEQLGCSVEWVRLLINAGKLKRTALKTTIHKVSQKEIDRYKKSK